MKSIVKRWVPDIRDIRKKANDARCTLDAHLPLDYIPPHSCSLRGVSGDEPLAERGMRRLQARLVTSSQGAQSPSGPDEGPAFSGLDNVG